MRRVASPLRHRLQRKASRTGGKSTTCRMATDTVIWVATTEERERALELINDEFNRRIEGQAAAGAAIDSKATLVVGTVVLAVQIFLGVNRAAPWSGFALGAFGVALVFGLGAGALRTYKTVPRPQAVVDFYEQNAGDDGPE